MDYIPGRGSVLASVVAGGSVLGATTQLPVTGGNLLNEIALAVAFGLITWAALYFKYSRSN